MDILESYKILGVSTTADMDEINSAFKKLAKKFHPDANPDKLDWAHKRMSDLNMAYQVVVEYKKTGKTDGGRPGPTISDFLKNLFKKDSFFSEENIRDGFKNSEDKAGDDSQQEKQASYYEKHPSYEELKKAAEKRQNIISSVSKNFKVKRDFIDEAMFVYYQYKLYKRGLRSEGIGRLKFGDVKRNIKKGLVEIDKIYKSCPLEDLKEELALYIGFVEKFKKFIDCKDYLASYKKLDNVEAFRFYRRGSEKLDKAFSYVFFETKTTQKFFPQINLTNLLSMAMENFIFIGEQYSQTPFAVDSNLKADLLDAFYRLYIKNFFK